MPPPQDTHDDHADDPVWEDGDEWTDRDAPQAADLARADEDETPTAPCPHCGAEVAELAERCPRCGDWIEPGAVKGLSPRLLLILVIAVLLILALLYWSM